MRTTLSIDDDVLNAAKHEALRRNATLSKVATDLIRAGLRSRANTPIKTAATIGRFAMLPPRDEIITPNNRGRTTFVFKTFKNNGGLPPNVLEGKSRAVGLRAAFASRWLH